MRRRCSFWIFLLTALVAAATLGAAPAAADIAPPWCGTPEPDAAENLPDGTDPTDPVGSFPHIPYYAIECTLESIAAESDGRMTVEVLGQSSTGRDMFLVTINALGTDEQQKSFSNWGKIRRDALVDPDKAQKFLDKVEGDFKVPLYIQGGIHGNEYEGVDANMRTIERLALTPYGADPEVDDILDHAVVLFNVIQNPDGRVAGTRANGNGFDLNRDFLTQSQSETRASVSVMQEWIPPEMLDLHGYATPTLIEATTKPHNPSIEYDLWLKWNQARIDANEAALNAAGYTVQRPINDWCSDASLPPCPPGETPGPAVAEGWDDWGPFYTPMYAQHVGLNGSTVEMCQSVSQCGGRAGAAEIQEITSWSSLVFDTANRQDLVSDLLEIYRRGVQNAPRPECCPPPFDVDNNWMLEYPTAYVIPFGEGQRSNPEANRLVNWLLFNGVEIDVLRKAYSFGGQTFPQGSYVVSMNQARRGLADTALRVGVDVSPRIQILYAPPAAWSHGYLWGADIVDIPRGAAFTPQTKQVDEPNALAGGVANGVAAAYALELDSPTAVRALNALVGDGVGAQFALTSFESSGGPLAAGSVIFPADAVAALDASGRANGLTFHAVTGALPALDPIEGVPRIAVLTGALNQDIWVLRNLGFTADPVATGATSALNNPAGPDPLANYDVVFNTGGWPSGATARARLTAFFNGGGGYIGAGANGANFLNSVNSGQLPGIAPATVQTSGVGQSGIFNWQNTGGAASPIVGAYPGQDTLIMDPIIWFTSVPAGVTVDGRLLGDTTSTFAAGLWRLAERPASAASAAIILHGTSTAPGSAARITAFAMNPLYRADPEREWPMISEAAYWSDQ
jgi:Zinc carboxypeptidase